MLFKRTSRGPTVWRRRGWGLFREEEEEERRAELGGATAGELGKLSGEPTDWFSFQEIVMVQLPVFPQELNLSYQDLGDPFQSENFLRILRRLIRVEKLQLVSNSLTDLSSVRLPRLEPLYPKITTAKYTVTVKFSSPHFIHPDSSAKTAKQTWVRCLCPNSCWNSIFLVNWPVFLATTLSVNQSLFI